jgi:hypothetical protein
MGRGWLGHLRKIPRGRVISLAVAFLLAAVSLGEAQRRGGFQFYGVEPNPRYNGKFGFVRLRYQWIIGRGWEYDYPAMERNLMFMVKELTSMRPIVRQSNVLDMDDPELFKWPVAYLSEPGFWTPSDAEAKGLRDYMAKGGFVIIDDFFGPYQWDVFYRAIKKVLPDAELVRLDKSHPIFNSFYTIETLDGMSHPASPAYRAQYYGIYEKNDRKRRLISIIDFNNDIGDYMEWSGQGWYPMNMSNDAYKFATNYLVYALTH